MAINYNTMKVYDENGKQIGIIPSGEGWLGSSRDDREGRRSLYFTLYVTQDEFRTIQDQRSSI